MTRIKTCIPLIGYRHMYRSLLRFTGLLDVEIQNLLYDLYIGNIDSVIYTSERVSVIELTPEGFGSFMSVYARPYFTEVQLYKSMEGLTGSIDRNAIIEETRTALRKLNRMMDELDDRFEAIYAIPITDSRTTYQDCWYRLTVRPTEPTTVLRPPHNALRPE